MYVLFMNSRQGSNGEMKIEKHKDNIVVCAVEKVAVRDRMKNSSFNFKSVGRKANENRNRLKHLHKFNIYGHCFSRKMIEF